MINYKYLCSEIASEVPCEMLFLFWSSSRLAEELKFWHFQLPVPLLKHIGVTLPVLKIGALTDSVAKSA